MPTLFTQKSPSNESVQFVNNSFNRITWVGPQIHHFEIYCSVFIELEIKDTPLLFNARSPQSITLKIKILFTSDSCFDNALEPAVG